MGWISRISDGIDKAFKTVRKPLGSIPPLLLMCEVRFRPGLSAIALTSSIIQRLPEAKIETGVCNCGAPNKINKLVRIICEEVINEFKYNGRVTCVLEPVNLNSIGTGSNAGGPVVVTSNNTLPTTTNGITE